MFSVNLDLAVQKKCGFIVYQYTFILNQIDHLILCNDQPEYLLGHLSELETLNLTEIRAQMLAKWPLMTKLKKIQCKYCAVSKIGRLLYFTFGLKYLFLFYEKDK